MDTNSPRWPDYQIHARCLLRPQYQCPILPSRIHPPKQYVCGTGPTLHYLRHRNGNEGHEHLKNPGEYSLSSNDHALPMFGGFQLESVSSLGGSGTTKVAYDYWTKNSVGNIVDMILQTVEWISIFSPVLQYFSSSFLRTLRLTSISSRASTSINWL